MPPTMRGSGRAVESRTFRELMAGFPTGVAIVTTVDGRDRPFGLTCSSLCSVSLEPPLLLVSIHNRSYTLLTIQERGVLAVNLLHDGGREAAELFATQGVPDRFDRVPWRPTKALGLPILTAHSRVVAECRLRDSIVLGDHTILVGEVSNVEELTARVPLLYGLRQYARWPAEQLRAGLRATFG